MNSTSKWGVSCCWLHNSICITLTRLCPWPVALPPPQPSALLLLALYPTSYQAASIKEGLTSNHHKRTRKTPPLSKPIFRSSKPSNLWAFFPFTLVVQKMISCNQCQVGADFGGVLGHSNCHHVSERSMKLRLKGRGIVKASNIEVKTPTYVTPCRMFCTLQYINTIMITCHDWKHLSKAFLISKALSSLLCLQNHISENCGLGVAYLFKKIEVGFRKPGFEGFANPNTQSLPPFFAADFFPMLGKVADPGKLRTDQGDKVTKVQSAKRCNHFEHWISVHLTKTMNFCLKIKGCWILNFCLASFQSKVFEVFLFCLSEFLFLASWTSSK